MPQVSVIMAVYNGQPYLLQAIQSILTQTFTDFEFIIIDDGSTDGSSDILARIAAVDSRLIVVRQAVQDAATRRGITLTQTQPPTGSKRQKNTDVWSTWGWWALSGGHVATARHYAWRVLCTDPLSRIELAFCADRFTWLLSFKIEYQLPRSHDDYSTKRL